MATAGVILDEATVGKLSAAANGGPVPLLSPTGDVIGYYLDPAAGAREVARRQAVLAMWSDEEIARLEQDRKNDPRPDVPHEEVLRWLEEQ